MPHPASLSLKSIAFERDDVPLFEGVTLSLSAGEAIQITGPNGIGKTTLMRIIAGALQPSEGEVLWNDTSIRHCREIFLSQMLYLGHAAGNKPQLTPRENLDWWIKLRGVESSGRNSDNSSIDQYFDHIGLAGYADTPCYALSAGQQRRAALVRLLATDTTLWILDEPFTAIDKAGVDALERLIDRHCEKGGMVVMSSHQTVRCQGLSLLDLSQFVPAATLYD
ncbi:MAG: cytochrome c biogenesis heme-transporting ATPase CcmA [bacterium]